MASFVSHLSSLFQPGATTPPAPPGPGAPDTAAGGAGSFLSSGLTAFQAFASIAAGNARADQLRTQAGVAEINAGQVELAGLREKNDLTDELLDTLARQRVALSGTDLSVGVSGQIFGTTLKRGDKVREDTMMDASIQARAERLSGRALLLGADNAWLEGLANAGGTLGVARSRRTYRG